MRNIQYLKNKDIDKDLWDKVIDDAPNGRIYAYSWYLDALAENWDALVLGDYEIIMPLPWNSKHGICYVYTPFFVQQLGLYSRCEINSEIYAHFFKSIPVKFRYVDLCINTSEKIPIKNLIVKKIRTNYILNIDRPYEEIWNGYKKDAKNKLRKGEAFYFSETDDIEHVLNNYEKLSGPLFPAVKKESYLKLHEGIMKAAENKCLTACLLRDESNEILVSGLFLKSHARAYHLASSQTPLAKEKNAKHFFIDSFIKTYCQQIKIFDFEGSDLPGVATFFKKWGSLPEYYSHVQLSRFPINLIRG